MREILLQSLSPCGVTFFQFFPPSRVTWIRPVSLPAQMRFLLSDDGAMVKTTPYPYCFALAIVGGSSALLSFDGGVAPVRSGLMVSQCRPPSIVFITYCVPR